MSSLDQVVNDAPKRLWFNDASRGKLLQIMIHMNDKSINLNQICHRFPVFCQQLH